MMCKHISDLKLGDFCLSRSMRYMLECFSRDFNMRGRLPKPVLCRT
jgi:hypothetical protein